MNNINKEGDIMSTRQSILEVIDDIDYTTNDVGFEVINEMVITNLKLINSLLHLIC